MARATDQTKVAEGREAEMFAWEEGKILRLLRDPSAAHMNDVQATALEAARSSGVRVPAVLGTATVNGRPGLVMERVEGIDYLTLIGKQPWQVFSAAKVSGELHARTHEVVAPSTLEPLRVRLRRHIETKAELPEPLASFALGVLDTLPDGNRLCHGDFHPGNILRTREGPVLIDWTNATRGEPQADMARTDVMLRIGEPPPGTQMIVLILARVGRGFLLRGYKRAYQRLRPLDAVAMARWEIPVVAARLADGIQEERAKLIRFLERAQAKAQRSA